MLTGHIIWGAILIQDTRHYQNMHNKQGHRQQLDQCKPKWLLILYNLIWLEKVQTKNYSDFPFDTSL